jgi:hypothetical protein
VFTLQVLGKNLCGEEAGQDIVGTSSLDGLLVGGDVLSCAFGGFVGVLLGVGQQFLPWLVASLLLGFGKDLSNGSLSRSHIGRLKWQLGIVICVEFYPESMY